MIHVHYAKLNYIRTLRFMLQIYFIVIIIIIIIKPDKLYDFRYLKQAH